MRWPIAGAAAVVFVIYVNPADSSTEFASMHAVRVVYFVALCSFVFQVAIQRQALVRHRLVWAVFGIVASLGLSVITAFSAGQAFATFTDFLKTATMFLVVANAMRSEKKVSLIVYVLVTSLLLASVRVLLGYGGGRAELSSAAYGSANILAETVLVGVAFALIVGMRWRSGSRVGRGFLLLATLPMLVVVLITNSRAGSMALVAGCAVMALRSRRRALALLVVAAMLAMAWLCIGQDRRERLMTIKDRTTDSSYLGRVYAWQAARQMFISHPLLGVGAGNFPAVYYTEFPSPGAEHGHWLQPHNVYYQVLSELGLVGMGSFGWLVIACFLTIRGIRARTTSGSGNLAAAIADASEVTLVMLLVNGWAGHNLYRFSYYLVAAVLVAADQAARASRPGKAEQS
jgi:O-antigen ligase